MAEQICTRKRSDLNDLKELALSILDETGFSEAKPPKRVRSVRQPAQKKVQSGICKVGNVKKRDAKFKNKLRVLLDQCNTVNIKKYSQKRLNGLNTKECSKASKCNQPAMQNKRVNNLTSNNLCPKYIRIKTLKCFEKESTI
ncbi:unnamed protein product [Moneuplotes crassus]|uniref:Uncharacterized protein n=1 Tax=Euplotes crassus TaxID=5936 RepID=A0AAD1XX15_EUPCR|nr:unnamed protein product [Moneuplotes crassus]